MSYSIIKPPFNLKFRKMSPDELEGYRKEAIPDRIVVLRSALNSDQGFEGWKPDYSPASIEALGLWVSHQVETRLRTGEEIDRIKARGSIDFDVASDELTNRTFSLAMDAGMYLGETLRKHHPHLKWDQPLKDKRFADFGQMVLIGFGRAILNPVRVTVNYCYGIAGGKRTAERFAEVYGYWSRLAGRSTMAR